MNVTIIGAGNTGLAMAVHAAKYGENVTLWNRSESTISNLKDSRVLHSDGVIEGDYEIDLVTTDMKEALKDPDAILITTPAFSHAELAKSIAENIERETTIVLFPGRTFGALEFLQVYNQHNKQIKQTVAETQTAIYTCRKTSEDSVDILSIKNNVLVSSISNKEEENKDIFSHLPQFIQEHVEPAKSMIETSIGNVGLIFHCAPLLLNAGWTENENHSYKYYRDGITPSVGKFLEKIDAERVAVSKALGLEVENTQKWLNRAYGVEGETIYECVQKVEPYKNIKAPNTLNYRYVTEDVPFGLVPLEAVGKKLGLDMHHTGIIIDLASALLETDYRKAGRTLDSLFYSLNVDFESIFFRSDMK